MSEKPSSGLQRLVRSVSALRPQKPIEDVATSAAEGNSLDSPPRFSKTLVTGCNQSCGPSPWRRHKPLGCKSSGTNSRGYCGRAGGGKPQRNPEVFYRVHWCVILVVCHMMECSQTRVYGVRLPFLHTCAQKNTGNRKFEDFGVPQCADKMLVLISLSCMYNRRSAPSAFRSALTQEPKSPPRPAVDVAPAVTRE